LSSDGWSLAIGYAARPGAGVPRCLQGGKTLATLVLTELRCRGLLGCFVGLSLGISGRPAGLMRNPLASGTIGVSARRRSAP